MGCTIVKLVTWSWPRPFQGWFVIGRLDMLWLTSPTYLKSLALPVTEIWKTLKNAQNWVVWGGYGSPKVISNVTIWKSAYDFLFIFSKTMHLSCSIFKIQWVICQNSPTLLYATGIWCPHWEWPHSNFEKIFGIRKQVPGLACGIVYVILCVAVLI